MYYFSQNVTHIYVYAKALILKDCSLWKREEMMREQVPVLSPLMFFDPNKNG